MIRDFLYSSYLGEGEKIVFVIHRHLVMELKRFFKVMFFGVLIPAAAWWLFPQIALFAMVWLGIGIIRFLYEFFDWYYDVWLVTNVSIVEVIWEGFFSRSSSRIEYHIIQGIGYEVTGLLRTIFNYGTITLEKYSGNPSVFDGAVGPRKKSEMLTQAQEEFVKNKSFRDHRALQGILTDLLQSHVAEHGLPEEEEEEV